MRNDNDNNNNKNNNNNNGHRKRAGWYLSVPREYGHFCPPESGVMPFARVSNPYVNPVWVTTALGGIPPSWSTDHLREEDFAIHVPLLVA